jgi:uncharacterized protein involved in outer membrane biogenesis
MPRDGNLGLMPRRRRRPLLRVLLGSLAALVVLAILAIVGAALLVDPSSFRPEIEAAAKRATGRDLVLRGPIHIRYGLHPRLVAENMALANIPGGSRPDMVMLHRLQVTVALLPLLSGRVEIGRLDLEQPDVLLETDAAGHGNWQLAPPAAAKPTAPPPAEASGAGAGHGGTDFVIRAVHLSNGRLTWHDGRTGQTLTLGLPRLDAVEGSSGGSVTLSGDLVMGGRVLTLSGETGSVERLLDPAATTPWPVALVLQGEGARLAARGTIAQPLQGKGYALQVDATATDLAPFTPLLPAPPPALHDASFSARVSDSGQALPDIAGLTLHLAGLDMSHDIPGLAITRADITAPAAAQPVHADVQATLHGVAVHLLADAGSLGALMPGASPAAAPLPVSATIEAAGAQAALRGTIAKPQRLAGLNLAVNARIPDLAMLAPLAGQSLPAWKEITLGGTITGDPAGSGAVALHGLTLAMPQAQISGDLDLTLSGRSALRGTLAAQRIDLDGLLAAMAPPAPPVQPGTPAPPHPPRKRLIPDTPIDLTPLRQADADLKLAVAALQTGGQTYSDVSGHLALQNGKLVLDPFTGQVPGGKLEGRLAIDAAAPDPPAALRLHAPALALQPLAAAFGQPGAVTGTAFVDADIQGHGTSPQALAASATGRLGLAMEGGAISPDVFGGALREVLRAAKLPEQVLGGGMLRLRCLALRLDAKDGVANVTTLTADAGDLVLQGGGTINLGPETLALHLRPMVKLGPGVIVPVQVGGTLLAPKLSVNSGAASRTALAGVLEGVLAGERSGNNVCGPALAVARGDAATPAPAAAAAPAQPAPLTPEQLLKSGKPAELLRGLLRR